ncbi:MAG: hypothetical protein ABSC25_13850 [Roseiarcus sp.]|jgi:hypothetical protein
MRGPLVGVIIGTFLLRREAPRIAPRFVRAARRFEPNDMSSLCNEICD